MLRMSCKFYVCYFSCQFHIRLWHVPVRVKKLTYQFGIAFISSLFLVGAFSGWWCLVGWFVDMWPRPAGRSLCHVGFFFLFQPCQATAVVHQQQTGNVWMFLLLCRKSPSLTRKKQERKDSVTLTYTCAGYVAWCRIFVKRFERHEHMSIRCTLGRALQRLKNTSAEERWAPIFHCLFGPIPQTTAHEMAYFFANTTIRVQ